MNSLPTEIQLDVLKCLNFYQLFSVKQTNFYFKNLINECERELARIKFEKLEIIDINSPYLSSLKYKIIEPESGVFEITVNDRLKKKWQAAIAESFPLFLHNFGSGADFVLIMKITSYKCNNKFYYNKYII
uniref:F-box domain-containing protein n=1 Tax=Meloidogyne enterolobii TaxID=390850 RepID=A0A6V7XMC7_MELEN|nr:unnamed protein product [Meloidogyne enterolobii]